MDRRKITEVEDEKFARFNDNPPSYEMPNFLSKTFQLNHDNSTFIIAVTNMMPTWQHGEDANDTLKVVIQEFIDKMELFTSRKALAKRRKGGFNLAVLKNHPLLGEDYRLVLSCKPPEKCTQKFSLLKCQSNFNRHEQLTQTGFQTVWLPANACKDRSLYIPLLQFVHDRYYERLVRSQMMATGDKARVGYRKIRNLFKSTSIIIVPRSQVNNHTLSPSKNTKKN